MAEPTTHTEVPGGAEAHAEPAIGGIFNASVIVALAMALVLLMAAGCKKGKAGVVPVNNPTSSFEKPDEDEIFPEDEDDTADGSEELEE